MLCSALSAWLTIIQLWMLLHPCQMRMYQQLPQLPQAWLQFEISTTEWNISVLREGWGKKVSLSNRLFLKMAINCLWQIPANGGLSPPKCYISYLEATPKSPFSDIAGIRPSGQQLQPRCYRSSAHPWSHWWVHLYTSCPSAWLPVPGMAGQRLSSRKPAVDSPQLTARALLLAAS